MLINNNHIFSSWFWFPCPLSPHSNPSPSNKNTNFTTIDCKKLYDKAIGVLKNQKT